MKNGGKCTFLQKNAEKICVCQKKAVPLHSLLKNRAFSSAGLEHSDRSEGSAEEKKRHE